MTTIKTRLPDNTTEWREACERAVSFANHKETDSIAWADAYLRERGWEYYANEYCIIMEADREIEYFNTGETYTPTVCCENGKCFVSSWGDWLKQAEQKYCQEKNLIRCVYCGEFTPANRFNVWCYECSLDDFEDFDRDEN